MKIEQSRWTSDKGWEPQQPGLMVETAQLVLLFGGTSIIKDQVYLEDIRRAYPEAHLVGCSTAGEIFSTQVSDDSLVATAVHFEHSRLSGTHINIATVESSYHAGAELAKSLDPEGLVHVLVLSDGLKINGSDLVKGLTNHLPEQVTVTGGLSADGDRFEQTLVLWDGSPTSGSVAAIGFYGDRLQVGFGSLGGWDSFGPERLITRSQENVLYELDNHSALELYKMYLGDHADGLPATGLLFPLSLRTEKGEHGVVRTILAVDEDSQSMTFAGDLPEGSYARLMKANFDRLIDGAAGAAATSYRSQGSSPPDLAVLISCVGRKLVLGQRVEEEVEAAQEALGAEAVLAGFYSYGEISPFTPGAKCELHNQTMTITTFSER